MVELSKLTLLAEGAQAEVFHYGDDRVLRVMRHTEDETLLKNEMAVIGNLREAGVPVPEVYEYMEIEGRPAVAAQKIKGESLMAHVNPFGVGRMGRILGEKERLAAFIGTCCDLHQNGVPPERWHKKL